MQFHRDLKLASALDRVLEHDLVPIHRHIAAEFRLNPIRQIGGRHRTESLARLAGLDLDRDLQLVDAAGKFLRVIELLRLALCTLRLQRIDASQVDLRLLQRLLLRDQEIPRKSGANANDVRLGAEIVNLFGEDDLLKGHDGKR